MAMTDKTQEQAFNFTRASTKWVWDGTGTLVEVPVDQPAYDHDPVTGEPLGVLIEPSATNLFDNSEDLTTWTNGSQAALVSGQSGINEWEVTSSKPIDSDGYIYWGVANGAPNTASGACISLRVKKGTARYAVVSIQNSSSTWRPTDRSGSVTIDFETSTFTQSATTPQINADVVFISPHDALVKLHMYDAKTTATFYRYAVSPCEVGANHVYHADPQGGSVVVSMPQLEEGSVATSYIPTAGAPVTRAADNMSRELGAEFNPSAGTIFVEYESPIDVGDTYGRNGSLIFRLSDIDSGGTAYNHQFTAGRRYTNLQLAFKAVGWTGFDLVTEGETGPFLPYGQKNKIAICYNSGVGFISAANGSSSTYAAPELPSVNWSDMSLSRACDGTTFFGHKSDVRYYPYAMTAAELEALTAL